MDWIDVSVPIRPGMVVFEGDPGVEVERVSEMERGDPATVSVMRLGSHTGTHVDAPSHMVPGGAGLESLPPDALIGTAWVADATSAPGDIDARALDALGVPGGVERLLLRTRNGALWDRREFSPDYVGVTEDGARALVERGVRLVGIDYLSIAPKDAPVPTHRVLLEAGVVVLEGLDLRRVGPGEYRMVCLPMALEGADGAPARTLLRPMRVGPADR